MVTIDFGNGGPVNMLDPDALWADVLGDYPTFNFLGGYSDGELLEILNRANPARATTAIEAYGHWFFEFDGWPDEGSLIHALRVNAEGGGYRVIFDGLGVSFPTLEGALLERDLSALYVGQPLEILGTPLDDTLAGGRRSDELYGYRGADELFGKGGNDYLDGMAGGDTMAGGSGNDDYAVNHVDDVIVEEFDEGIDLAIASIDYTLPDFVEDLALLDEAGAIDGVGNDERNFMAGNASANLLEGLAGNDTLVGLAGHDVLDGGDDADRLFGGGGNDVLVWDEADARVHGGGGNDILRLLSGDLDLRAVADGTIVDVERIDMRGGVNVLTLSRRALLDLSSTTNVLRVLGEAGDTVDITSSFVMGGQQGDYTRYAVGPGVLWVDSDITVV